MGRISRRSAVPRWCTGSRYSPFTTKVAMLKSTVSCDFEPRAFIYLFAVYVATMSLPSTVYFELPPRNLPRQNEEKPYKTMVGTVAATTRDRNGNLSHSSSVST